MIYFICHHISLLHNYPLPPKLEYWKYPPYFHSLYECSVAVRLPVARVLGIPPSHRHNLIFNPLHVTSMRNVVLFYSSVYLPISTTAALGKWAVVIILAYDTNAYVAVIAGQHPSFVCGVSFLSSHIHLRFVWGGGVNLLSLIFNHCRCSVPPPSQEVRHRLPLIVCLNRAACPVGHRVQRLLFHTRLQVAPCLT